ncbi:MAG TPA: hypothetical protein VIC33_09120 [Vicinamibacterales bacterium]
MSGQRAGASGATFVTAVYERSPDDVIGGRGFPLDRYLLSLASIVRLDAPLVVYTQRHLAARLTEFFQSRGIAARVLSRPLSAVPHFWPITELRIRQRVHTKPYRDRCHLLCFAKFAWLADQARDDPFGTARVYWIDAGLSYPALFPARHLPRPFGVCDLFTPALPAALDRYRPFLVCELAPMPGRHLHSVDTRDMERLAGVAEGSIATHIVGGLFGGMREQVLDLYDDYDRVLARMLSADLLGTEENVLTVLFHRDPSRFCARTFTTWHHEDTDFTQPAAHDVPFYRMFQDLESGASTGEG